jgi:uncharacterized membrane protein
LADLVFLTLLCVHILFIVAWLGASMFGNISLSPDVPKMSSQGKADFWSIIMPKAARYGMIAGMVAVADGVLLYAYINFVNTSYAPSAAGLPFIQGGALLGLLLLLVAVFMVDRTSRRIRSLSIGISEEREPPAASASPGNDSAAAELGAAATLQKRLKLTTRVGMALLVLVLLLMVVGANI